MKTKTVQRVIQIAAVVFLIWLVVHDLNRGDYSSLTMGGAVGAIVLAHRLMVKKFAETAARCRFLGKLIWAFISLALLFAVLSLVNFDLSASKTFSAAGSCVFALLCLTYIEQQRLLKQSTEERKTI